MTCADTVEHIDAFVDGELSASVSIEVARHVSQCSGCDGVVRSLLGLRETLVAESERAVAALDLSDVWTRISSDVARAAQQAAWRQRVVARGTVPRRLAWGAMAALAAGTLLFLRSAEVPPPLRPVAIAKPVIAVAARVGGKRLPNHVYIDRLAGKDIALRREPKSGTTMIWVNHEVESSGW